MTRNKIALFFIYLELPIELVHLIRSFCDWYETSWEKGFPTLTFFDIRKAWEEDFGIYIHWCQHDSLSSLPQNFFCGGRVFLLL